MFKAIRKTISLLLTKLISAGHLDDNHQINHYILVTPDNFELFTYSKRSHFGNLRLHESQLRNDLDNCDLKFYQDMLTYNFILENFPPGSRLLEIGGGDSRIIKWLKDRYEFWNLDKLEGVGNGLTEICYDGFRLVQDYIGSFTSELPDGYFDGVFSISVLEHVPKDATTMQAICDDIQRLLKPGGLSMHCFDVVIKKDFVWTHPLLDYLYLKLPIINPRIHMLEMAADPDLWGMSKIAYDRYWRMMTKVDHEKFGMPVSYNVIWRND